VVEIREGEMTCYECGGTYVEKHGTLVIGDISVDGVDWHECNQCGGKLLPLPTCEKYDRRWRENRDDKAILP
jgi:hypothetical protein